MGQTDDLIEAASARPEAVKVQAIYERLGIPEWFRYVEHPGWHELDVAKDGIDFLAGHLLGG
jgi:hypothetical protein